MSTNLFLTKGAKVEDLAKAMPKAVSVSGFVAEDNRITYNGNPKALKFVIPKMRAVVESLPTTLGFTVIEEPKVYVDKNGKTKTTKVVSFGYTNHEQAQILCENVNNLCKAEYDAYLKAKK